MPVSCLHFLISYTWGSRALELDGNFISSLLASIKYAGQLLPRYYFEYRSYKWLSHDREAAGQISGCARNQWMKQTHSLFQGLI